jgi:site-specific DNA recombinase
VLVFASAPAQKGAETMERAVLYARVSYDDRDNDGRNLKGQLDMCREYALANGWRIVDELSEDDKGASGADFDLPKIREALQMARAGDIDILVTRELDRFARGLAKQLIVEQEFKRAGVQVEYVLGEYPDTPEGNLMKNVRAVVAEYERLKITERMNRGKRDRVNEGNVMARGLPPYGYNQCYERGPKGKIIRSWFETNEAEEEVVKLVFQWYTVGDGVNGPLRIEDITRRLTERGVPTFTDTSTRRHIAKKQRGRGEWNRDSVYKMLKNETYTGVWYYGKRRRVKQDGRWKTIQNPRDRWLAVEVPEIVPRTVWEAAQRKLAQHRPNSTRQSKYQFLLSKRATCGCCGLKMHNFATRRGDKIYPYYNCQTRRNSTRYVRECDLPAFRGEQVDAAVWDWVRSLLSDPAALFKGLEDLQKQQDEENKPIQERLEVIDGLLSEHQTQLDKLLDLYLSGDFPKEILIDRKRRLEDTINGLEKERAGCLAHLEALILTQEQIQTIQGFATQMAEGLDLADQDFGKRRQLIEALNVEGALTIEDDRRVIYARCVVDERVLTISNTTRGTMKHIDR